MDKTPLYDLWIPRNEWNELGKSREREGKKLIHPTIRYCSLRNWTACAQTSSLLFTRPSSKNISFTLLDDNLSPITLLSTRVSGHSTREREKQQEWFPKVAKREIVDLCYTQMMSWKGFWVYFHTMSSWTAKRNHEYIRMTEDGIVKMIGNLAYSRASYWKDLHAVPQIKWFN